MPVSRFDVTYDDKYTPQYVPMPFDALGALGKITQDKFDTSIKGIEDVSNPIAKLNPSASIKVYDPNVQGGIRDVSVDFNSEKNQHLQNLANEKQQIIDDYFRDSDTQKFNKRTNEYLSKASQIYSDLATKEAITKKMQAANDALAKNEDAAKQGYLANPVIAYNTQYLNNLKNQGFSDYAPGSSAKVTDRVGELKNYFKDLGTEVIENEAKPTGTGYIRDKYLEGLEENKISKKFNSWFEESQTKHDVNLDVNHTLALQGLQGDEIVPVIDPSTGEQLIDKNGKPKNTTSREYFTDLAKQNLLNAALGYSSSKGSNSLKADATYRWKTDKEESQNIVTTNEQGNPESLDIDNTLLNLGLNDVLNNKGEYKTNSFLDSKYTVTKPNGEIKTFNSSVEAHKFAGNTGVIQQERIGASESANDIVNKGFSKLAQKSKELGLPTPQDGDYRKQLYNYAIEIAKRRATTTKFQQSTIDGMNKAILGPNSDISNMEFYIQGDEGSNAKVTAEQTKDIPKNSRFTGIDFYGPNQAGLKLAVSNKDDNGNIMAPDKAYLAVPKDKVFEKETRAVHTISRGALDFARTGKVNSKFIDQDALNLLQSKVNTAFEKQNFKNVPKLISSAVEKNKYGDVIVMGSYIDNSKNVPELKGIVYNETKNTLVASSLDEIQINKTKEIETKGSIRQYNINVSEKVKPSEVEGDYESNND